MTSERVEKVTNKKMESNQEKTSSTSQKLLAGGDNSLVTGASKHKEVNL